MGEHMKRFYAIAFSTMILDRVLKIIVENFLSTERVYIIKNFFYLVFVKNTGAAFSSFEGMNILFILVALCALIFIVYYIKKNNSSNIGYALLFGGIIGNLIDRIVYRYVIDFIGFEFGSYSFPIFNIADMAIVIGALFVLLGSDKNEITS